MPPRYTTPPSEPPSLTADKSIPLIQRQVERMADLEPLRYDDPSIDAWESTTWDILDKTYGRPQGHHHHKTGAVMNASRGPMRIGMSPGEKQRNHLTQLASRKALLLAYIEQLKDGLAPLVLDTPGYMVHPEIQKVSGDLLRDGHFKQAALEAYIRVIEEVKRRSGLAQDGDALMNFAFGSENRLPILAFNSLASDSERDEQRGIMFLFKGIVGLRNSKAHSNALFNDPSRAHEYLALASLLMRLLEIATKAA